MIKDLIKKYGVEYSAVRKMSVVEVIDYLSKQGFDRYQVVFDFYKFLGWSDRMAGVKTQNFMSGGFLL